MLCGKGELDMEQAVDWKGIWKRSCGCIIGSLCVVGTSSSLFLSTAYAQILETEQSLSLQETDCSIPINTSFSNSSVNTNATTINMQAQSSATKIEEFDSFTRNFERTASQQAVSTNLDHALDPSAQCVSNKLDPSSIQTKQGTSDVATPKEVATPENLIALESDGGGKNSRVIEGANVKDDEQSTIATESSQSLKNRAISCRHRDCLSEVEFSIDEIKALQQAANNGDASSQNIMGLLSLQGKYMRPSPYKAAIYFVQAAAQNYAEAQNNLGELYLSGHGVDQDYTTAFQWFDKSAAQGLAQAEYNLGRLYMSGMGVNQNYVKAWELFNHAAEQGHVLAQFNVGKMYLEGMGVKADKKQAGYWFSKSCQQNFSQACRILDKLGMEVGNF